MKLNENSNVRPQTCLTVSHVVCRGFTDWLWESFDANLSARVFKGMVAGQRIGILDCRVEVSSSLRRLQLCSCLLSPGAVCTAD